VLLDGAPVSGCLTLAAQVAGREVTTVEGLEAADPVQRAFDAAPGPLPPMLTKAIVGLALTGCGPQFRAPEEVHHCTNYYALVFLNRVLKGDVAYTKYLSHGLAQRLPVHFVRGDDLAPS